MAVKVKMEPVSRIKAHLGIEPNGRVQRFFTNTCYKRMDKYVPKRQGNLRTIVDVQADKIIYESPYASYQYYGIRKDGTRAIKKRTTLGTVSYWDKKMWSINKDDILDMVQQKVNRGGY